MNMQKITKTILDTFAGSFLYDKEIRIPMNEDGELIQIKVTLTAAKNMVAAGGDTAIPGATLAASPAPAQLKQDAVSRHYEPAEPSEEEKKNVVNLINLLGL